MNVFSKSKESGFTLIELIVVIIIMGVLASATTVFIKFSTVIYSEATDRDQLVSSARFAIERLNREVRNALPNSLRLDPTKQCLEFTPIIGSSIYTDIPVFPDNKSNTITVIESNALPNSSGGFSAIVYPLTFDDVYPIIESDSDKIHAINNIVSTGEQWVITLNADVVFSANSPTQRIYFIETNNSVNYCVLNNTLTRNNILMADNINSALSSFDVMEATLQRNAMVQIHLQFEKNDENITFENEVQVLNVP